MSEVEDREELIRLIHATQIAVRTKNHAAGGECFVHEPYLVRWGLLARWRHLRALRLGDHFLSGQTLHRGPNAPGAQASNALAMVRGTSEGHEGNPTSSSSWHYDPC
jgi:hypothetical protein